MRRLLTFIVAFVSVAGVISPGAAQVATPAASPVAGCVETSEDENEAIVMRWYAEALNQQDLDVFNEIIAEDADHSTSLFSDSTSRDETKAIVSSLLESFPDLHTTIQQTMTDGDLVAVRWTSTGTFENAFQGVAPTGEQATWTGINIFRIECGMIAESWNEVDRLAQIGQGTEPVATPATSTDGVASPESTCAQGTEEANEAIVTRWYMEALNNHDVKVFDEILAEDAGHHTSVFEDSQFREQTKANFSEAFTAYPDLQASIEEIMSEGDLVAVRWTNTGTFQESLQGVAPTGESVTFTGINLFRLECGVIVESWSEVDVLAQSGQDIGSVATPEIDPSTPAG